MTGPFGRKEGGSAPSVPVSGCWALHSASFLEPEPRLRPSPRPTFSDPPAVGCESCYVMATLSPPAWCEDTLFLGFSDRVFCFVVFNLSWFSGKPVGPGDGTIPNAWQKHGQEPASRVWRLPMCGR